MNFFSFPTNIYFGSGVVKNVATHLKDRGFRRPLIVTDKGVSQLEFFSQLQTMLKSESLEATVFCDLAPNPHKKNVEDGAAAYKSHKADCMIGIGGGAPLDVAKAVGVLINHDGDLFDYEDEKPGAKPIDKPIPYWIAIPTTSGTGSEVGRSAVISDPETKIKKIIYAPTLLAPAIFADPELTFGLPQGITAATGMDALTHNVEAYLAKNYHPICDGIALEGIYLVATHLQKVSKSPKDVQARGGMLMSSMMGAIAFQKGLGVVHSCAHALGTVLDLHHGLANALMIDHALTMNVAVVPERFIRMNQTVGIESKDPKAFLDWLVELKSKLNIPAGLKHLNIDDSAKQRLVDVAFDDVCHPNNPVAVTKEDFQNIFNRAFNA